MKVCFGKAVGLRISYVLSLQPYHHIYEDKTRVVLME